MSSLFDPGPVVNSALVADLVRKEQSGQAHPLSRLMTAIRRKPKQEKIEILTFALRRNLRWGPGEQRRTLRVIQGMRQVVA